MKKWSVYVIIGLLLFSLSSAYADRLSPEETIKNFFQALKQGDVTQISNLIGGKFYQKNKQRIENNPAYSEFLRNYYQESDFRVIGTTWKKSSVMFTVETLNKGAVAAISNFQLAKDSGGHWKIIDEVPK